MKLYAEMIGDMHDSIVARERLEWSNFWYDSTNKNVEHRVLLIGDSTARMIRSRLSEKTGYAVDLFGISSGLHDVLFVKQIDAFFSSKDYKYEAVFIQIGHHSRIGDSGEPYSDYDYLRFKKDYIVLISFLQQYIDKVVLLSVFYSVIPFEKFKKSYIADHIATFIRRFLPEKYDDEINIIKKKKNEIIEEISNEMQLPFCDINKYMINLADNPKTKCLHTDHVHFEEKAKDVIVKKYIEFLNIENTE